MTVELVAPRGGRLNPIEHLVVPHNRGRLTTLHVPRLDVGVVVDFLSSAAATVSFEWLSSENGSVVHAASLARAAGGVSVFEAASRGWHIPIIPVRAAGPGRAVVMLGCPGCPALVTVLYLRSAGPDGQPTDPGAKCRRCSRLAYGAPRLLCSGKYARQLAIELFESVWPELTESAPTVGDHERP